MNKKNIIILLVVIGLIMIAFFSMKDLMTPYVSFNEAKTSGKFVQIIGNLKKSLPSVQHEDFFEFFLLDDKGASIKVHYKGVKPVNFEHASQIVALGAYQKDMKLFQADKVLTKCPSKYTKGK